MFKKIALAALAVVSVSAFAQDRDDMTKYDTYNIGKTDLGSNPWTLWHVVKHELKGVNANDAYTITSFESNAPADQSWVVIKALAYNYKQASMIRDEVANARYGSPTADYAWLSYPPLTWSGTPGQNSWSNVTMNDGGSMSSNYSMNNVDVADSTDSSRAMRMVMRGEGRHDISTEHVLDILGSGLTDTERGTLREMFHPTINDPTFYTNQYLLDALTRVVESNSQMVRGLGRYAWYNHFDKDYYNNHRSDW